MINRIIVLDPGKKTGLVDWKRDGHPTGGDLVAGYEFDFAQTCRYLLGMAGEYSAQLASDVLIVSESFIITQQTAKNSPAPWSLEIIGVARMVSELYLGRPLILQSPSSAKRFSTDERLRYMGWYQAKMGHANDAFRHLLLLQATRGMLSNELLTAFADKP